MKPSTRNLATLFQTLGLETTGEENSEQLRRALRPIIRLALRKRKGLPQVVRWVDRSTKELRENRGTSTNEYRDKLTETLAVYLVEILQSLWQSREHFAAKPEAETVRN